jgi:hypothetical protein
MQFSEVLLERCDVETRDMGCTWGVVTDVKDKEEFSNPGLPYV